MRGIRSQVGNDSHGEFITPAADREFSVRVLAPQLRQSVRDVMPMVGGSEGTATLKTTPKRQPGHVADMARLLTGIDAREGFGYRVPTWGRKVVHVATVAIQTSSGRDAAGLSYTPACDGYGTRTSCVSI